MEREVGIELQWNNYVNRINYKFHTFQSLKESLRFLNVKLTFPYLLHLRETLKLSVCLWFLKTRQWKWFPMHNLQFYMTLFWV